MTRKRISLILIPVLVLGQATGPGARADFILNGNFNSTTSGNGNTTNVGQLGYNITAANWTTFGYGFLLNPSSADSPGAPGQYGSNNFMLWGPGNGSANGLTASPTGGNYIAGEGDASTNQQLYIAQDVMGLTAGNSYTVGFWWAGAQQFLPSSNPGSTTATTESWDVTLGSSATQSTNTVSIAADGFSGWMYQTFTFTADSTSDYLIFHANGGPAGAPPFSLLDGVTLNTATSVPEPSSILMLGLGLLAFGAISYRKRDLQRRKALALA